MLRAPSTCSLVMSVAATLSSPAEVAKCVNGGRSARRGRRCRRSAEARAKAVIIAESAAGSGRSRRGCCGS